MAGQFLGQRWNSAARDLRETCSTLGCVGGKLLATIERTLFRASDTILNNEPETLRDVLAPRPAAVTSKPKLAYHLVNTAILTALTVVPLIWGVASTSQYMNLAGLMIGLLAIWWGVAWFGLPTTRQQPGRAPTHMLLAHDRQRFMGGLRLDQKTAVLDGSNLYHFGHGNDVGGMALSLIVKHLRAEGYRIICFFDANIYYELIKQGDFQRGKKHELMVLMQTFGLHWDEIFIVPSGTQADKYILSSLKHLPLSFAVTNDQFRDYGQIYGDVMQGNQWRKGVYIQGNEVKLRNFRFKMPARLTSGALQSRGQVG